MPKTLTKRELVSHVSAQTSLTQSDVFNVVQSAIDVISATLEAGHSVVLRNFGTFQVKTVKAKIGRNPKAPTEDVTIPARSVVKFKVGKELKHRVAKPVKSKSTKSVKVAKSVKPTPPKTKK